MTHLLQRFLVGLIAASCLAVPALATESQPLLRIESPTAGSILNTRQPWIRVCLPAGD